MGKTVFVQKSMFVHPTESIAEDGSSICGEWDQPLFYEKIATIGYSHGFRPLEEFIEDIMFSINGGDRYDLNKSDDASDNLEMITNFANWSRNIIVEVSGCEFKYGDGTIHKLPNFADMTDEEIRKWYFDGRCSFSPFATWVDEKKAKDVMDKVNSETDIHIRPSDFTEDSSSVLQFVKMFLMFSEIIKQVENDTDANFYIEMA